MSAVNIEGHCDPAFGRVKQAFQENFAKGKERGAGVSIVIEGRQVVNIWAGHSDFWKRRPWTGDTLANIYSATKGVTAVCAPVYHYWPGFEKKGKEYVTVRMLLNHTAWWRSSRGCRQRACMNGTRWFALLKTSHPGGVTELSVTGHIIRKITGMTAGQYLKNEITGPLGLDMHIGLNRSEHHRCASMIMLRAPTLHADCIRFSTEMLLHPLGPTARAFTNPVSIVTGVNTPAWRSCEIPSANGQATAGALAMLYGVLANGGSSGNTHVLSSESIDRCCRETASGNDAVLKLPTRFSLGFMLNQDNRSGNMGPGVRTFGHPGAGGSLGFADPDARLGFGYVMNKMDTFILVDPRAGRLIAAVYECL